MTLVTSHYKSPVWPEPGFLFLVHLELLKREVHYFSLFPNPHQTSFNLCNLASVSIINRIKWFLLTSTMNSYIAHPKAFFLPSSKLVLIL